MILPMYYRYLSGSSLTFGNYGSYRTIRNKERCIIFLVCLMFFGVSLIMFIFLPEFSFKNSFEFAYLQIKEAGPSFLLPPPLLNSSGSNGKFLVEVHKGIDKPDPHVVLDRIRFAQKVQLDSPINAINETVKAKIPPPGNPKLILNLGNETKNALRNGVSNVNSGGKKFHVLPLIQGGEDPDPVIRLRRNKVKEMMKHAWDNYALHAWGKNELKPVSSSAHLGSVFGKSPIGTTIVDGLDTLFIMEMLDEYNAGKDWLANSFDLRNLVNDVSVFEMNIRYIGGLLSCYALTGDDLFKIRAVEIADALMPAFNTTSGIPYSLINVNTKAVKNYAWASGGSSILSEFGTLHLEFAYLSDVTGNPMYRQKVDHIRNLMHTMSKPDGLYPNYIDPQTGKWGQTLGDSFYEYLLKTYIQSGKEEEISLQMYLEAISNVTKHLVQSSHEGLTYLVEKKFDRKENKMDHLACFAGGLFALTSKVAPNVSAANLMTLGEKITETCHESYARTATGLGPETFRENERAYRLRPEVVESYFILWRLTHDVKYREWGWEVVLALEKHCRVSGGYTGIYNVYEANPKKDDVQQSYFLAETLKYLYLLFSSDDLISLDEWVFNTEAHPLPVKGANPWYFRNS